MNKTLTTRLLAVLMTLVTLLALAPMVAISFHNHPFCDDYMFSAPARKVWVETGSLIKTVEAGFQKMKDIYYGWQGCYTVSFLSALQPGVFSENLYYLVTLALLGMLILSVGYLSKVLVMDILRLGASETVIVACLCVLLMTQLAPDAGEAFYWCNGGVAYTLMQSLLFLAFAQLLRLEKETKPLRIALRALLIAILMFLAAGGNFSTGLFGAVALAMTTLCFFIRKSKLRFLTLGLYCVFLTGFALNVLAPGNAVRMTTVQGAMSAPRAVGASLLYAGMMAGKWTELTLLGAAGLCVPIFVSAAKKTDFSFKHPLLVTLLTYCVFATLLTPPLYAGAYVGGGRQLDIDYDTYVLLFLSLVCYWTGFAVRRTKDQPRVEAAARFKAPVCAALCLCMLLGAMGFDRGDTMIFGLRTVTGGSALRSMLNGEAARYDEKMDAREALLGDASLSSVAISPVDETPEVFMDDLLSGSVPDYALGMIAGYYGKTEITLAQEQ